MGRTVTPATLAALITGGAGIVILDVRRRPAFAADTRLIAGAVWKDPEQVTTWAAELDRRQVVAYCMHGHEVSRGVVDHLRSLGIDAALLEGGFEAWKAAGGPLISPDAADPEGSA